MEININLNDTNMLVFLNTGQRPEGEDQGHTPESTAIIEHGQPDSNTTGPAATAEN